MGVGNVKIDMRKFKASVLRREALDLWWYASEKDSDSVAGYSAEQLADDCERLAFKVEAGEDDISLDELLGPL